MKRLNRILLAAMFFLAMPACAAGLSGQATEGRVLEEGTHQPIPEAIVVVLWKGHRGYSGTVCYHVESATTDAQGRYRTPAWSKSPERGSVSDPYVVVAAHKPGYQWSPVLSSESLRISV